MKDFMGAGKRIADEIETALTEIDIDLDSFENILDFGCGWGRTLLWFSIRKPRIYGTDIDAHAIKWASENLDFGTFTVNKGLPPLEHKDNTVAVISVFAHLNEDYQIQWLKELKSVLKYNGILIITVHGEAALKDLIMSTNTPTYHVNELQKVGFIYITKNDITGTTFLISLANILKSWIIEKRA
jgi:cyclopropane fatty-acyl-phospholipid synthase-like methyltransferase